MTSADGAAVDAALAAHLVAHARQFAAQREYDVAVAMAALELPEYQRLVGIRPDCPSWWPA